MANEQKTWSLFNEKRIKFQMKSGEINSLFKNLSKIIKNPRSDLKYKNKFTLLVSVVLSAQCTDVNVNNVTRNIYPKYNKPEHFVRLGRKNI